MFNYNYSYIEQQSGTSIGFHFVCAFTYQNLQKSDSECFINTESVAKTIADATLWGTI